MQRSRVPCVTKLALVGIIWRCNLVVLNFTPGSWFANRQVQRQAGLTSTTTCQAMEADGARPFNVEELAAMLQRPGAIDDMREIMSRLLNDPKRRKVFNATVEKLSSGAAEDSKENLDPFARLLSDPRMVADLLQSPRGLDKFAGILNSSALVEDLRELGATMLEQMQISKLDPGSPVEITGLVSCPELNECIGKVAAATPQEASDFPGRVIVVVDNGDRIAVQPENLRLPRFRPGDAVTLATEFAGEHEGLEGRAALVSEMTADERNMGYYVGGGRVVVDVLPLIEGGPVVDRLLMWPEHLKPRAFLLGDGVELQGLKSATELNGARATVATATAEEAASSNEDNVLVILNESSNRILVPKKNLKLKSVPVGIMGFG